MTSPQPATSAGTWYVHYAVFDKNDKSLTTPLGGTTVSVEVIEPEGDEFFTAKPVVKSNITLFNEKVNIMLALGVPKPEYTVYYHVDSGNSIAPDINDESKWYVAPDMSVDMFYIDSPDPSGSYKLYYFAKYGGDKSLPNSEVYEETINVTLDPSADPYFLNHPTFIDCDVFDS